MMAWVASSEPLELGHGNGCGCGQVDDRDFKNGERSRLKAGLHTSRDRILRAPAGVLILLVMFYRWVLSPLKVAIFGEGARCRFEPSCSGYALEALRRHGFFYGSWLAGRRLLRCHPWGAFGADPVPVSVGKSKSPSLTPALFQGEREKNMAASIAQNAASHSDVLITSSGPLGQRRPTF